MIPLLKVFMPANIEGLLGEILHSGQLSYGCHSQEFERKVQSFIGNEHFIATSSFNAAMIMALYLADVRPGDEVISSPMSCLATNQPIMTSDATIVWADIDPWTGSLDPDDVARKITDRTKAIVHCHWAGNPGYIEEINRLAKDAGVVVIEDASESFGSEYMGNLVGNNGTDMVCFSFETIRMPNTIDGGGISFRDESLYQKALLVRDYGINRVEFRDEQGEINARCDIGLRGYGAKMNNLSGFIGSRQMDCLADILEKQRNNGAVWDDYFRKNKHAEPIKSTASSKQNYWVYNVLTDERDKTLLSLRSKGYYASKLHLRNDVYSVFGVSKKHLPGVTSFNDRILCLPCGWWFDRRLQKI